MRTIITFHDVQTMFSHRKKSFCYQLLAKLRGPDKNRRVTVDDLADYTGMTVAEVREAIRVRNSVG